MLISFWPKLIVILNRGSLINWIAFLYELLVNFSECISRLNNRYSTELLVEMEDPSDPSLSLLSSSKNHVSRDATNIIPSPSNLQDPVIKWPDTTSDSSKKNSKFDLCALCVLLHVQTRMYVFLIWYRKQKDFHTPSINPCLSWSRGCWVSDACGLREENQSVCE